jgi:endoribonuclease Dicer
VDPDWLDIINAEVKPDSPFENFYRFRLLLPLNSPLREEIVGPFLPSKRSAKRAVALEACTKLHKLQELDDVHLLPATQVDQIEDELVDEEVNGTGARSGTSKRKQCYPKKLAKALVNCLPQPEEICFVYVFNFKIINCCNDNKKFYYPNGIENKMAILTSNCLPKVCSFPLVTRAGEMDVEIVGVNSVIFNAEQLEKLKRFHRYLIEDVILLFKTREEFDFENPTLGLLIVPLKKNEDFSIDFDLVDRIIRTPPIDWDARPDQIDRPFDYDPALYMDAVLTPWYMGPNQRTTYYVDAVTRMTPLSAFPDEQYTNYADYVS